MLDHFVEDLKGRIDITDIISGYAELKKAGRNFICCSPLRHEKTPSFSISQEKQVWYDFGVSEGGDVISFLEKIENISFREAVERLAQIAGVEVPRSIDGNNKKKYEEKDVLYRLHQVACQYFKQKLAESLTTQEYLKSRNISLEITELWGLGFGGDDRSGLTKFLLQQKFTSEEIACSGVAFERNFGDKKTVDRFWKRLIIPIRESRNGQIIAFTARDLTGNSDFAKYINSSENPVYHKSKTLFGLDFARRQITTKDIAIIVEGNFDVIRAHEKGLTHTVATCGTSLTEDHLRILKKQTKNIYLAFDSDLAGKKAMLRAVEMVLKAECNPYVIQITNGKDFDDALQHDTQKQIDCVDNAPKALDFLLEAIYDKNIDGTIEGEKKFLDKYFYFLNLVFRPIEKDFFIEQVAKKIGRAKMIIEKELQRFVYSKVKYRKPKYQKKNRIIFSPEQRCVGLVIAFWDRFEQMDWTTMNEDSDILEQISKFLQEEKPKLFLQKLLADQTVDQYKDDCDYLAWTMNPEHNYESEPSDDVLYAHFRSLYKGFVTKKIVSQKTAQQLEVLSSRQKQYLD